MNTNSSNSALCRPSNALKQWLVNALGLQRVLANAPRVELEQTILRVAIGGLVLIYLLIYTLADGQARPHEIEVDLVAIAFLLFGIALMLRTAFSATPSVTRRLLGMVADNAVTTYCLIRMGEGGAVVLGVFLFVAFGNGFRYGRKYLHASQVLGLVGFSVVLVVSEFWAQHVLIGIGILLAMLVLPFYVGVLAERINEARQRADEANNAKGRFLATVSHEMRTPLNGVIAMADVLCETQLDASQREMVETLGTSAHLLYVQIEDVLDMAKIDAGRVQIESQPFDLAQLVATVVKVVLPQARAKQLAICTHIDPGLNAWFAGDAHHLRQVLLNLVANAVKFTEKGEIQVRVLPTTGADQAGVRFEVEDTGIGIPAEKQATIFEPFTQADDSITRIYGGTGLGTTIARELVGLMGGSIGLHSTLGVGSLFWLELPLAPTDRPESAGAPSVDAKLAYMTRALAGQSQNNVSKIRSANVLVAEDNPTNQRVVELILSSAGYRVTIVGTGEAALDELERGGYDLALFDLSMPLVSGLDALRLYRFTTSKPIPVVILSASVTSQVVEECTAAGAAEFVAKPIRPATLLAAVERHLVGTGIAAMNALTPPPRAQDRPSLTVVDTPPIDQNVLDDLDHISPDPTFIARLVDGFRADTQRLVKEISDGFAARKYDAVQDAAHALKGGAGSVGATELVMIALKLQKASPDMLRLKAAVWTQELISAVDAALAGLDRHLASKTATRSG